MEDSMIVWSTMSRAVKPSSNKDRLNSAGQRVFIVTGGKRSHNNTLEEEEGMHSQKHRLECGIQSTSTN